jgi:hypothetical protein
MKDNRISGIGVNRRSSAVLIRGFEVLTLFEKTKPILHEHKLMQVQSLQRIMKKNAGFGRRKNKANQSQFTPKGVEKKSDIRCQKTEVRCLFSVL